MSDILLAEYTLKRALREHTTDLIPTTNPHILCTPLPKHWRSNKSLPNQFRVVSLANIPDGTRVSVTAGNEERPYAELKNPVAVMHLNEARFSDLRFLGRSGRGKSFNITITIETTPLIVAIYSRAIKVTVDGPRVPRNKYSTLRSVKLHKESRRLVNRIASGFEHGRTGRPPGTRNTFFQQDALRLNLRRSLMNAREALREPKDQLTERFRNPSSTFSPAMPDGKANTPHLHSPTVSEPTVHTFFQRGQQPTPSEKSPASSETSIPSFTAGSEPRLPFSPFESAYLLSFINEAYAKLLARQLQIPLNKNSGNSEDNLSKSKSQFQPPTSGTGVHSPVSRSFPQTNGEINPDLFRTVNRMMSERNGPNSGHPSFSTARQEFSPISPLLSLSAATRPEPKRAEASSPQNFMGNGYKSFNSEWCNISQQRDFRAAKFNQPTTGLFPPPPLIPTGFNSTGLCSMKHTGATVPPFVSATGNPTFPACDPAFYNILGSMFASMLQQGCNPPWNNTEKGTVPACPEHVESSTIPHPYSTPSPNPVNMKVRNQVASPSLNGKENPCSENSRNAILSIEKLLDLTANRKPANATFPNRTGLDASAIHQRLGFPFNLSQSSDKSLMFSGFPKPGINGHSFLF